MKNLVHLLFTALLLTATAYHPYECGSDGLGALGQPVLPDLTVAVSRDLRHLLGKWVHIEGVGQRYVNDTMAARWRGKIDLCVGDATEAAMWGAQTVKVRVLE